MYSYEEDLKIERNGLLSQIEKLDQEIKRLEAEIPNASAKTVYGYIDDIRINSDTRQKVNWGKTYGTREMPVWEVRENIRNRIIGLKKEKEELQRKVGTINNELFKIDWGKPENVAERERQAKIKDEKAEKKQLEEERLKHDERFEDLEKLVEYLKIADMYDLAEQLAKLRFAFIKPKDNYITEEIDLQSKEKAFSSKTKTTKKEYREIKKSVTRLTKSATRTAKKYKELYKLYLNAWEIVQDIEEKGISKMRGDRLVKTLKNYFTQPTGIYLLRDHGNYYSRKESENLGYQYLEFYRDYGSKYNEDVREHRL